MEKSISPTLHRIQILIFLLVLAIGSFAQTFYQRGYRSVSFTDPSRSGRSIPTDLYYPANTAGTNVAVASGTNRFPVVVFGHGFSLPATSYTKLADSLTRYGYIVALPTTETGLSPSHDNFGKDLSFLCTAIIQLDTDPGSFLYQRVTSKAAVGGHSMGGGCSFLAAGSGNPNIFALFNMAAAETTPSATAAAASVNVPALLFSGSNDCIVPPATQQSMYNNMISNCKSRVTITGATHCQIADNNFTCAFGQISSGCNSSPITVNTVYAKTTELLIPFLDYTLNGICTRGVDYVNQLSTTSGITTVTNCPLPNCSILPIRILEFKAKITNRKVQLYCSIQPDESNPTSLEIERSSDGLFFTSWKKWDIQAMTSSFQQTTEDAVPFKPHSFYRLKLTSQNEHKFSAVIQTNLDQQDDFSLPKGNVATNDLSILSRTDFAGQIGVRILSMDGRLLNQNVFEKIKVGQIMHVPTTSLPAGLYIAEIKSNNFVQRIRFSK